MLAANFGRAKLRLVHSRVTEGRDPGKVWLYLFKNLKLLGADLGDIKEKAGKVAAGAGQTSHPSLGHWIRLEIYCDDRNGRRGFGHGLHGIWVGSEYDVDPRGDEPEGYVGVLLDFVLLWRSDIDD